jgi:hypothetical protein
VQDNAVYQRAHPLSEGLAVFGVQRIDQFGDFATIDLG